MKVLLTKPFFEKDIQYIKNKVHKDIELIIPNEYNDEVLASLAPDCEVLFGPYLSETLLSNAKNAKLIQIPWTGVDNLNFDLINKYNIPVANSHSNAEIVAEHAVALMFDSVKKISFHDRLMRNGDWNRPGQENNVIDTFSHKVTKSNIALIGFGSIGKKVYKLLNGFDCNFNVFNRSGKGEELQNVKYYNINQLNAEIANSNIIFVCIALTEETKNMLSDDFFAHLNKNTIIVNISRGEVFNENALYNALKSNQNLFAAIDTWYQYPSKEFPFVFPSSNNFQELDNITMSPHRAGMLLDGLPHLDDAIENLNRLNQNLDPINIVSIQDKY